MTRPFRERQQKDVLYLVEQPLWPPMTAQLSVPGVATR